MFSTMSISSAPAAISSSVSAAFVAVVWLPCGKPTTVETSTSEPATSSAAGGDVGGPDGGRRDVVAERQLDALADGGEVELRPQQRVVDRLGDVAVLQGVDPDSAALNHGARIRQ